MIFWHFPRVYAHFYYICEDHNLWHMLIGREKECRLLQGALTEEYSQFIAVYGRRRVGKTFLIREAFDYTFGFQFTGAANTSSRKQLARFRRALKEQGQSEIPELTNWGEAFDQLKMFINNLPAGKKVVFLDELPWMDAPRSGFLSELESFWNGWASARKDIVFVVCGSSTSWMVKKIIKNKGGLHNRLNHRIALKPFSLGLCEKLCVSRGLQFTRKQILEAYMVFGGVPYYWSLLQRGASMTQEIDRLIFAEDGEMHDEFEMLYSALFKQPQKYIKVIELLAEKRKGLTRMDIIDSGEFEDNGSLSIILEELEWCGFIRSYNTIGYEAKMKIYQLIDHFTLFYYDFVKGSSHGANYWSSMLGTPRYNTWCGLAFERVCLWHVEQIKMKLGITGIATSEYAWKYLGDKKKGIKGVQIDLLIDRSDGIIDLCEIKDYKDPFHISEEYALELERRRNVFVAVTGTRSAVHTVIITAEGLVHNNQYGQVQNEVTLDDLFCV